MITIIATLPTASFAQGTASAPAGQAIVVTGTTRPVTLSRLGNAITIFDAEAIGRRQLPFLQELLREVPGVAVNQTGGFGGLTQVRIRGGEGNHTLVLIDGIEVAAIGQGEFDFSSLIGTGIERVEVLRGPQSGLYGSNAIAGVISIITRGGEGPRLETEVNAGSFGTVSARAGARLGNRETFLAASAQALRSAGISSAAIGTETDAMRNLTFNLRGGARIAPGARLDASLRFTDRFAEGDGFDFTGGPLQGLAVDDDSFSDMRDVSLGATFTLAPAPAWSATVSLAFTDAQMQGGNGAVASFGNRGTRLRLAARASREFAAPAGVSHLLTLFADHERERYRNTFPFDPSQVPLQSRQINGLGAEYRLDLFERLFLRAALRRDANNAFADATTYSITGALLLNEGRTRLFASQGTGIANPTFNEQFGFIPGSFVGNPALRPERARGFDLGIEHQLGEVASVQLVYFRSRLVDEIVNRFPSVANDTGTSRREGVEASARMRLGPIELGGTYTRLNARDPDGTREVRRPRHMASLDASGRFGPAQRGTLTAGLVYNGRMLDTDFRDFFQTFSAAKSPLEAYWLARLVGSWRLTDTLVLTARVENLIDQRYQQVISYGAPGLSAFGGLRMVLP